MGFSENKVPYLTVNSACIKVSKTAFESTDSGNTAWTRIAGAPCRSAVGLRACRSPSADAWTADEPRGYHDNVGAGNCFS